MPPTSSAHPEGHLKWAKLVEEKTGGRVEITVYTGETLGKARDAYDMRTSGLADLAWRFVGLFPGRFPLAEVIGLPPTSIKSAAAGSKVAQEKFS